MADFVPRSIGRLGVPPHAEVGRDMPLHEVGIGLATYAVGTVSGVRLLTVLVQDPRGGRTPDVPCGPSAGVLVLLPITVVVAELSAADRFGSSVYVAPRVREANRGLGGAPCITCSTGARRHLVRRDRLAR